MKKKIDETTPKKQKRSNQGGKTSIIEKEKKIDSDLSDIIEKQESESDIAMELAEEPEVTEADVEIDSEELSDLLEVIEQEEESIDEVIDLIKDEDEPEDIKKLLKYSDDDSTVKVVTPEIPDIDSETEEDEAVEVVEEFEHKPKSRWLITTCRYCGDMYRFRSDQTQPPTCGRPKCISRFEEINKKKAALVS